LLAYDDANLCEVTERVLALNWDGSEKKFPFFAFLSILVAVLIKVKLDYKRCIHPTSILVPHPSQSLLSGKDQLVISDCLITMLPCIIN
jgi:hypothetical protein